MHTLTLYYSVSEKEIKRQCSTDKNTYKTKTKHIQRDLMKLSRSSVLSQTLSSVSTQRYVCKTWLGLMELVQFKEDATPNSQLVNLMFICSSSGLHIQNVNFYKQQINITYIEKVPGLSDPGSDLFFFYYYYFASSSFPMKEWCLGCWPPLQD